MQVCQLSPALGQLHWCVSQCCSLRRAHTGHVVCPAQPRRADQEAAQGHGVVPRPVGAAFCGSGGEGGHASLGRRQQERQPQQGQGEGEEWEDLKRDTAGGVGTPRLVGLPFFLLYNLCTTMACSLDVVYV